jgi:hypothetical protein
MTRLCSIFLFPKRKNLYNYDYWLLHFSVKYNTPAPLVKEIAGSKIDRGTVNDQH